MLFCLGFVFVSLLCAFAFAAMNLTIVTTTRQLKQAPPMDADQIAAAVAVQAAMQAIQLPAGPCARSPALAHQNVLDYSKIAGAIVKGNRKIPN